jgi:hypothetical protein
MTYTYSYGHKSRDAAKEALAECYCTGEVSDGDKPAISSYRTLNKNGETVTRWQITCRA